MRKTPIDWAAIAKDWESFVELDPHTDHRELSDQFWQRKGGWGKYFYTEGVMKNMPRGFIEEEIFIYEFYISKPEETELEWMGWREIKGMREVLDDHTSATDSQKEALLRNLPLASVTTTDHTKQLGNTFIIIRKTFDPYAESHS